MRTLAKILVGVSIFLFVTAPGWTVFFEKKRRGKLVLGVVLVGLLAVAVLVLKK